MDARTPARPVSLAALVRLSLRRRRAVGFDGGRTHGARDDRKARGHAMIVGYFVNCEKHSGMVLDARDNLLYFGGSVTFFLTRRPAQQAIRRTLKARPTFQQEFGRLSIERLAP